MTLRQLACFCATAREGSFSAAGRQLRLSQPSVSEQVRRLEAELSTRLLVAGGRGVALTTAGRTFLVHAERVLAGAEEAAVSVGSGQSGPQVLSLGLTRNAPYYPFWKLFELARKAQPELDLHLPGQNSSRIADAVRSGGLQAAIVILPVDPAGLEIHPLFKDEVLLVSADPARLRVPAQLADLGTRPLILYDTSAGFNDPTRRQLAERAQQSRVALVPQYDVEHLEMALQFAARGWGDTIAPRAVTRGPTFPRQLGTAEFADPLYDTFALITRVGVHPASLASLQRLVEQWVSALPDRGLQPV